MNILVINGPNLNMLGVREPEIYGRGTYEELCNYIKAEADKLGVTVDFYQSNSEGDLVDAIQGCLDTRDGLIINPGGYTHSSIALPDAIAATGVRAVEVHISNPSKRDLFRNLSYIRNACEATFMGNGFDSYIDALHYLVDNQ